MKISHPLASIQPAAYHFGGQMLSRTNPITIPLAKVTDDHRALEKAGQIRIIVRGKNAMLVKL